MSSPKGLALFDFDGTITTKDTFLEFIKYYRGGFKFYTGFMFLSPWIVFYKLNIVPNWKAKQQALIHFFKNEDVIEFEKQALQFSKEIVPSLVKAEALEKIKFHKENGHRIVIVTASAEDWLTGWCAENNVELLGTKLQKEQGRITGLLASKNCYGDEKICRIQEHLDLNEYTEIYAYGDTSGDLPMLSLAQHQFYRAFNR